MNLETKEKAVPNTVVGATEEQQISKNVTQIIAEDSCGNNTKPTETSAMTGGLEVLSMTELYDSSFEPRVPVVDGLLNSGTYIFAGAPKVGKSFFMAQLAYHVAMGIPLWDYPVRQGSVLYLALEDDYARLQQRLAMMFGDESTDKLYLAVKSKTIKDGLAEQMEYFVREHKDARLIIIDTLQRIRESDGDKMSYGSDYDNMTPLKEFSDKTGVDEARVAGIPEDEIVAMRKELVSSEIQKSIKENGSKPELLGKIIKKAVATLAEKIKLFKAPKKEIPTFDFDEYNKMLATYIRLNVVEDEIDRIDSKIKHKQKKQEECVGIRYQAFKIKLIKEISALLIQRSSKQDELAEIVRTAGYKDVNRFMKAFEKNKKLLEEYQAQTTMKRESVIKHLKSNIDEAKLKPHAEKTLSMEEDLKKKKDDDPR